MTTPREIEWTPRRVGWYAMLAAVCALKVWADADAQVKARAAVIRESAEIKALLLWGQVR